MSEIVISVPKIQGQAEENVRVLWDVVSTCKGWRDLHGMDLGLVTKLEALGAQRVERMRLCKSVGADVIANKANKTWCQHEASPVGPGEHVCRTRCW